MFNLKVIDFPKAQEHSRDLDIETLVYSNIPMAQTPDRAPPCQYCLHFFVTFDPHFPRGCREFDLKTHGIPSHEIFKATGKHCPSFQENPKIRRG